eukprot:scaffold70081_cov69-Cyclotella_meneghiniana.AAC.5
MMCGESLSDSLASRLAQTKIGPSPSDKRQEQCRCRSPQCLQLQYLNNPSVDRNSKATRADKISGHGSPPR